MLRACSLALAAVLITAACTGSPPATTGETTVPHVDAGPDAAPPEDWMGQVVPRNPNVSHPGYEVVPDWPKLPAGTVLGESVGVEVDAHNHVFVFHRADKVWGNTTLIDKDTVFVLDGDTGELVASWGKGLFLVPHGLTVDQDNHIWVTDVELNQIFELTHDGQLLQTIGAGNGCACPDAPDAFNMPTDVALVPGGDAFVSDGYGNSRVAEFTVEGAFVKAWGEKGLLPGELRLPHGIAIDGEKVYVADRTNARIQVFSTAGALVDVWTGPDIGRPWGVAVGPDHHVFFIDGGDQIDDSPSGRAVELDQNGKLVTNWGSFGSAPGQFDAGHAISVGADGSVYVVEQVGKRVQKFRKVP